jgi:sec-independent protein translocase protein TatA
MGFGMTEMLIILAIVVIIFGAGKLPSVMGDIAKGVRNFKAGLKDEPETPPAPTQRIVQPAAPPAGGESGPG